MTPKINFKHHTVEPLSIILVTRNFTRLGQLSNVETDSIRFTNNLNEANEISFSFHKTLNNYEDPLWDDVRDFRIVFVKELAEYFEIEVTTDDSYSSGLVKQISGRSLCEAELDQTVLYDIEINTETDISRENYVVTKFYNPDNTDGSLLHRVLEKVPHYSIQHVDESLWNLQRTFSIDGTSVYSFLTGDCASEFNCLFQFDSQNRSISVYDLYSICLNDNCSYYKENKQRYRDDFDDVCPYCNSTNISYFGEDTTVFVDNENLSDDISLSSDADSVKNTFRLEAGDDDMTAAIINNNPNGSQYITYFSDETKADMPDELVGKIESYEELYDSRQKQYGRITQNIYNSLDQLLYLTSSMMPTREDDPTNAEKEAAKLTVANLSPTAIQNVTTSTSVATVNSALVNYAKVYIRSGNFSVKVNQGSFTYKGTDTQGYKYGNWTGNFTVTNYSDSEDTATSKIITVKIYDNYEAFLKQRVEKSIAKNSENDDSIYDVLNIESLTNFKKAITYYALNSLKEFYDSIQGCLDILVQAGQSSLGADFYNELYTPYYDKLLACQNEMDVRQDSIETETEKYNGYIAQRNAIQDELNFRNYLGEDLYLVYCAYRREDTYSNSNYVSNDLDNTTIFNNANEFLEVAKKELVKAGTLQHTISANIYNLLLMDEFKPIVDYFEIGNFIRVKVDNDIYRLRLISYEVSYNSLSNLNTTFSDMTKVGSVVTDVQSILNSAKSMASSYGYYAQQASQGEEGSEVVKSWLDEGLNSANVMLKSNDEESIIINRNGLLAREYDDILDNYSPKQLKLTHNLLVFTQDNWETTETVIGNINYYNPITQTNMEDYGIVAKAVLSGYIQGSTIVGTNYYGVDENNVLNGFSIDTSGNIKAANISGSNITGSTFNNGDGTFSVTKAGAVTASNVSITGGSLNIGNGTFKVTSTGALTASNINITGGALNINNVFKVDSNGNLIATNATISGSITNGNANSVDYLYLSGHTLIFGTSGQIQCRYDTDESGYHPSFTNYNILYYLLDGRNKPMTYLQGVSGVRINVTSGAGVITLYSAGDIEFRAGNQILANKSITISSDSRIKEDVQSLDEFEDIFMNLKPCSYYMKDRIDNTRSIGFKAQEVAEAMDNGGIPYEKYGIVQEFKTPEAVKKYIDTDIMFGLRYDDFIALNTHMIQKQKKRIDELETKMIELENNLGL